MGQSFFGFGNCSAISYYTKNDLAWFNIYIIFMGKVRKGGDKQYKITKKIRKGENQKKKLEKSNKKVDKIST